MFNVSLSICLCIYAVVSVICINAYKISRGFDTIFLICYVFKLYLFCFRAYRLLLLTYCVSLSRQTDETPAVFVIPRARIDGVLGRLQEYRKGDTPPPPYDSPPPYHVAVVMESVPDLIVSEPVII